MTEHSVPGEETPLHQRPDVYPRRWKLLALMCLSLTLVVMAVSGLNVALPSIQRSLETTNSELQWVVDSYALVFAGFLLTAGAIGDRFGRRNALLGGLVVFAAGAVLAGLAREVPQVIAGRGVMGVGAAFIMPATLSMVTGVFPPEERRKAIAVWAGFAGAGGAIGPIVSGVLLELFWWGSTLLVNVPAGLALMAAIRAYAPRSRDPARVPLDPVGASLSLVGVVALVYAIIEGPVLGWSSAPALGAAAVAVVALGGFVAWEWRSAHPMLPLELFGDIRFRMGSAVIVTGFFAMFGFFYLNNLYLQFVRGYSALLAGLATLPVAIMLIVVSPRTAGVATRFGSGRVIAAGFTSLAAGFAILALVEPSTSFVVLAVAYVLIGGGLASSAAPATGNIMSAVPDAKAGVGSAVNDSTRELGGALGIAVLGSITNAAYRSDLDLTGLGLPAEARLGAEESVGAVTTIAERVGPAGRELIARTDAAFTDAFNLAAMVSAVVAITGAVAVVRFFTAAREKGAEIDNKEAQP